MIYTASHLHDEYISLDEVEYKSAVYSGRLIWQRSQERALHDYHGTKPNGESGMRLQELGAVAERAVAKWLNVYWGGGYNTFKGADLDKRIEVRLIGVDNYGLRVRDGDADNKLVVGVVIPKGQERQRYRLPGWILAKEAKKREFLMNPWEGRPMYAVPQQALNPMATIKQFLSKVDVTS
jgi:hypothetical protein